MCVKCLCDVRCSSVVVGRVCVKCLVWFVSQAELRRVQAAASELLKEAQIKKQIAERKLKSVYACS